MKDREGKKRRKCRPSLKEKEKEINEKVNLEALELKIKKKNNNDFEDYDMIDNVITKNFFMRTLDTNSR